MTRTILIAAAMALGLGSVTAFAQDAPPEQRDGRRPVAKMVQGSIDRQLEELNLTEEQKKQVEPILNDLREQIRTATQDAQQKIGAILTEEQRTKFRESRERGAALGGPGANLVSRVENAVALLDLTDDQKAKLKEIFDKFRPEFDAVREQAAGDPQAMMESSRPLLQDLRSQVIAVLTPEQTAKLQEQAGGMGKFGAGRERPDKAARDGSKGRDKREGGKKPEAEQKPAEQN